MSLFLAAMSYKYLKLETEPKNLLENNFSSGRGINFLQEKETLNLMTLLIKFSVISQTVENV